MATDTILFVDDEKNILSSLTRLFRKDGYNILTAESGRDGLMLAAKNELSLIVSDHRMPEMEGVEFLSKVKALAPDAPRFMLTGYADINAVMAAINKGEVTRFITKPWNDEELKLLVRDGVEKYGLIKENNRLSELTARQNVELTLLNKGLEAKVEEKTKKIRENFSGFVRIFADVMELYDGHVGGHSKRVAMMAKAFAERLGLGASDVELIETAALLHNIGLIGVPREIIDKDEGLLTADERALMRQNPVLSQDILSAIDTLRQAGTIIRSHMERYDGKGWPDKLKKDEIHIGSAIISACRLYDELKHKRQKTLLSEIIDRFGKERLGMFSGELADGFVDFIKDYKEEELPHKAAGQLHNAHFQSLPVSEVKPGMVLAKNLVTSKGNLLVPKGTALTHALIEKILNFHRIDPVTEGACVTLSG